MSDFKIGDKVTFPARVGTSDRLSGEVASEAVTSGEGRARKTFVTVKGDDGRERKVMPSHLRAA
jgi:hypothetical protein